MTDISKEQTGQNSDPDWGSVKTAIEISDDLDRINREDGQFYIEFLAASRSLRALSARIQELEAMQGEPDDGSDLDARMKAAGMIPLSELLEGHGALEKWLRHADVHSFEDFVAWIKSKQRSFMTMRMRYELGDENKDDDLFEWVFAHAAAFDAVATQLRAITPPADAKGRIEELERENERLRAALAPFAKMVKDNGYDGTDHRKLAVTGRTSNRPHKNAYLALQGRYPLIGATTALRKE